MLHIPLTSGTENMTSWTLIILLLIPVIFLPDTTGRRSVRSGPKPHQIRALYSIALWTSCSDPNQSPLTSCTGPYRTAFWLIHRNTNRESTHTKMLIHLICYGDKQAGILFIFKTSIMLCVCVCRGVIKHVRHHLQIALKCKKGNERQPYSHFHF